MAADSWGTPVFNERWRQGGFFDAMNRSTENSGKATPAEMTRMNAENALTRGTGEMRKAMGKLQAAMDRIELNLRSGKSGGRVDAIHFDRDAEAIGGWLATVMGAYGNVTFYMSEASYKKAQHWMGEQGLTEPHASHSTVPTP